MFPKIISIGDFFLPSYGVLVATAFLVALWMTGRLARRSGLDPEKITNLGVYAALSGLIGAKLMMFVADYDYYREHPSEVFSLSSLQAGGIFYGGLILALVVTFFFMRRHALPLPKTMDAFAPGLALGQGIGRLGCFAAGCCWGKLCDRSWAVTFTDPEAHRLVNVPLNVPLYPTQLIEAASGVLIFAVLYWQFTRPHAEGRIISLYLVLAGLARFLVEFYRQHDQPNPIGGSLTLAQWISLVLIPVGLWMLLRTAKARALPVHP